MIEGGPKAGAVLRYSALQGHDTARGARRRWALGRRWARHTGRARRAGGCAGRAARVVGARARPDWVLGAPDSI